MHRSPRNNSKDLDLQWQLHANDVLLKAARLASQDGRHDALCQRVATEQRVLRAELLEYQHLCRKYDPDQPRAPAGTSGGGQWVSEGGSGSAVADKQPPKDQETTTFQGIAATASSAVHEAQKIGGKIGRELPIRKLPLIGSAVTLLSALKEPAIEYPVEEALRLYNAIVAAGDPHTIAIVSARARQYVKGESEERLWASVLQADMETVKQYCPRYLDVQNIANDVAATMGPIAQYGSQQNYGNQFHLLAAGEVQKRWQGQLLPELFMMAPLAGASDEYYKVGVGTRETDSIGLDVYERVDDETACIYDFKTGARRLRTRRMNDFSYSSAKTFPKVKRFFVIEIRPSVGPFS